MDSNNAIVVERTQQGQPVRVAGPGLVDVQINGYAGLDFNGPVELLTRENLTKALEPMRRRGVVAILATLTTDAVSDMLARVRQLTGLIEQDERIGSMIPGFHIEGPMINPEDGPRGAHPLQHTSTPAEHPEFLEAFQDASGGRGRILTLAPELPGAEELIARAAEAGIVVALGHHAAEPEHIERAVKAGARMCTHLGNGSHAMLPRLENYIQRQLADDRLHAGFIPDGHHIPFPTLKNFIRAKGTTRSVLVTDAIAAADMPPGEYGFGRRVRRADPDGAVRLPGTPYLAGSALTLDKGVLNVAEHCDVPFETAWAMASTQPAALVGLATPRRVEVDVRDGRFHLLGQ